MSSVGSCSPAGLAGAAIRQGKERHFKVSADAPVARPRFYRRAARWPRLKESLGSPAPGAGGPSSDRAPPSALSAARPLLAHRSRPRITAMIQFPGMYPRRGSISPGGTNAWAGVLAWLAGSRVGIVGPTTALFLTVTVSAAVPLRAVATISSTVEFALRYPKRHLPTYSPSWR